MKQWFNQLAPRERRVLIIGAVTLGGILLYFMLWEPFVTTHAQLKNIVAAQKVTLQWMKDAALEIQQLRRHTPSSQTSEQSLLGLIDRSIRSGRLDKAHKRIEQKGEREVQVNFEEVSFTELMQWLGQLYNQHQVQVSSISLERLRTPDSVKVRLTLKM